MKKNLENNHVMNISAREQDRINPETQMRYHYRLLGHKNLGCTELRIPGPPPLVSFVDNEDDFVSQSDEYDGKVFGIYVGVNPRPVDFMEFAPNCWQPARGYPNCNCAKDTNIDEFITTSFIDIDVISPMRISGYPASPHELRQTEELARAIASSEGFANSAVIACSGNGHYVITPMVPISVDCDDIRRQFKIFHESLIRTYSNSVKGCKLDKVFNASRVMRVMGTMNKKGIALDHRPHRRAHFITDATPMPSMALHHMILNTDIPCFMPETEVPQANIKCNLATLEKCDFIQWCRQYPTLVSEQQWFGLITNLAHLDGGPALIHEISCLDTARYTYDETQRRIDYVISRNYKPFGCKNLTSSGVGNNLYGFFQCKRMQYCPAKAPMYLTAIYTV